MSHAMYVTNSCRRLCAVLGGPPNIVSTLCIRNKRTGNRSDHHSSLMHAPTHITQTQPLPLKKIPKVPKGIVISNGFRCEHTWQIQLIPGFHRVLTFGFNPNTVRH
ncbi:hypothetical protein L596_000097 [Steinernema carpocapsae]|uniref:Uncharacterized protein n=1 Tax=Steinernema carpocapsae TaxID=34508 RepID=A0A4U8ULB2_STECR|nr:hypothetical protein L596_000097 [Steinernema carpocapsae]